MKRFDSDGDGDFDVAGARTFKQGALPCARLVVAVITTGHVVRRTAAAEVACRSPAPARPTATRLQGHFLLLLHGTQLLSRLVLASAALTDVERVGPAQLV